MIVVRGVQIWSGLSDEEGCEGALCPVVSLCGVRFGHGGGDDEFGLGDHAEDQTHFGPTIATVAGRLVGEHHHGQVDARLSPVTHRGPR